MMLGPQEILILLILFALIFLVVWPMWRILVKAGLPGPLGLLVLVPGGLVILLFVLAFVPWPALQPQSQQPELRDDFDSEATLTHLRKTAQPDDQLP